MVKEFISILGVQGLVPTNDMSCGECWNVDWIFSRYHFNWLKLGAY